jgi:hypothetical protein
MSFYACVSLFIQVLVCLFLVMHVWSISRVVWRLDGLCFFPSCRRGVP